MTPAAMRIPCARSCRADVIMPASPTSVARAALAHRQALANPWKHANIPFPWLGCSPLERISGTRRATVLPRRELNDDRRQTARWHVLRRLGQARQGILELRSTLCATLAAIAPPTKPSRAAIKPVPCAAPDRRQPSIPIDPNAEPGPRGFLPWRLSDAGPRCCWLRHDRPASETLHTSDGRRGRCRLPLFDPEAVVQDRTSILQEARLGSTYRKCIANIPSAATRIPCACSCLTGRPPQPCRIAHSRTLRCRPTTCQMQEPAGLEMPPSASCSNVPAPASQRPIRDRIADTFSFASTGGP
jgi:hypothetical protein